MISPEAWLKESIEESGVAAYPVLAAADAVMPYAVYERTGTAREGAIDVLIGAPVGTFLVHLIGESYADLKDLAEQVRGEVNNFNGSSNGSTISSVRLVDEADAAADIPDGSSSPVYQIDQTYAIAWEE